jgi:hypothetical protein
VETDANSTIYHDFSTSAYQSFRSLYKGYLTQFYLAMYFAQENSASVVLEMYRQDDTTSADPGQFLGTFATSVGGTSGQTFWAGFDPDAPVYFYIGATYRIYFKNMTVFNSDAAAPRFIQSIQAYQGQQYVTSTAGTSLGLRVNYGTIIAVGVFAQHRDPSSIRFHIWHRCRM